MSEEAKAMLATGRKREKRRSEPRLITTRTHHLRFVSFSSYGSEHTSILEERVRKRLITSSISSRGHLSR